MTSEHIRSSWFMVLRYLIVGVVLSTPLAYFDQPLIVVLCYLLLTALMWLYGREEHRLQLLRQANHEYLLASQSDQQLQAHAEQTLSIQQCAGQLIRCKSNEQAMRCLSDGVANISAEFSILFHYIDLAKNTFDEDELSLLSMLTESEGGVKTHCYVANRLLYVYTDTDTTLGVVDCLLGEYSGDNLPQMTRTDLLFLFEHYQLVYQRLISTELMYQKAYRDPLTDAWNRRYLFERLSQFTRQPDAFFAFALIDLDFFKKVNDELGHLEGDEALKLFVRAVKQNIRVEYDVIARVGGEEFALILNTVGPEQVGAIFNRFKLTLAETPLSDGRILRFSAGVVFNQAQEGANASRLYSLADNALYEAKKNGRDNYVINQEHALCPQRLDSPDRIATDGDSAERRKTKLSLSNANVQNLS